MLLADMDHTVCGKGSITYSDVKFKSFLSFQIMTNCNYGWVTLLTSTREHH